MKKYIEIPFFRGQLLLKLWSENIAIHLGLAAIFIKNRYQTATVHLTLKTVESRPSLRSNIMVDNTVNRTINTWHNTRIVLIFHR